MFSAMVRIGTTFVEGPRRRRSVTLPFQSKENCVSYGNWGIGVQVGGESGKR
jgi:hypothetical protein